MKVFILSIMRISHFTPCSAGAARRAERVGEQLALSPALAELAGLIADAEAMTAATRRYLSREASCALPPVWEVDPVSLRSGPPLAWRADLAALRHRPSAAPDLGVPARIADVLPSLARGPRGGGSDAPCAVRDRLHRGIASPDDSTLIHPLLVAGALAHHLASTDVVLDATPVGAAVCRLADAMQHGDETAAAPDGVRDALRDHQPDVLQQAQRADATECALSLLRACLGWGSTALNPEFKKMKILSSFCSKNHFHENPDSGIPWFAGRNTAHWNLRKLKKHMVLHYLAQNL